MTDMAMRIRPDLPNLYMLLYYRIEEDGRIQQYRISGQWRPEGKRDAEYFLTLERRISPSPLSSGKDVWEELTEPEEKERPLPWMITSVARLVRKNAHAHGRRLRPLNEEDAKEVWRSGTGEGGPPSPSPVEQ